MIRSDSGGETDSISGKDDRTRKGATGPKGILSKRAGYTKPAILALLLATMVDSVHGSAAEKLISDFNDAAVTKKPDSGLDAAEFKIFALATGDLSDDPANRAIRFKSADRNFDG